MTESRNAAEVDAVEYSDVDEDVWAALVEPDWSKLQEREPSEAEDEMTDAERDAKVRASAACVGVGRV